MAELLTDRTVITGQLGYELGGVGIRTVGPYPEGHEHAGKTKVMADVTEAVLLAAVDAHDADDGWTHPNPPPSKPEPTPVEKLAAVGLTPEDLKEMLA